MTVIPRPRMLPSHRRPWSLVTLLAVYVFAALAVAEVTGQLVDIVDPLVVFAVLLLAPVAPPRARAWLRRQLDRFAWEHLAETGKLAAYTKAAVKQEAELRALRETTQVLQPVPQVSTVYAVREHPREDIRDLRMWAALHEEDSGDIGRAN